MLAKSLKTHILLMVALTTALTACDLQRIDSLAQVAPEVAKALTESTDTTSKTAAVTQPPNPAAPVTPYSRPATVNPYGAATPPYPTTSAYGTANPYGQVANPYTRTATPYGQTANPYGQTANPYGAVNPYAQTQQRRY